MPDTPSFLAERLKNEGEKTAAFFAALTDDQWQKTVYTENAEWRVRDVLAHYVSAEKAFMLLFEDIHKGGSGASEDFSIDRFNVAQVTKLKQSAPKELLAEFVKLRTDMTAFVADLCDADLQKTGRHAFLGVTTLAEMVKMVYRHNQIHYRDLRRVLEN